MVNFQGNSTSVKVNDTNFEQIVLNLGQTGSLEEVTNVTIKSSISYNKTLVIEQN